MAPSNTSYHVNVGFKSASQPSHYVNNGFNALWVGTGTPTTTDLTTLTGDVWSFYNSVFGGPNSVSDFLGGQISRVTNDVLLDVYNVDLLDSHHHLGSPVFTTMKTVSSTAPAASLPAECCAVLSFRTAYGTDPEHDGVSRPRAQDRGRIYVGPLSTTAATFTAGTGGGSVTINPNLTTVLMTAAAGIKTAMAGHNWAWAVWSRFDKVFKPVGFAANDNNFDTQRRRGPQTALLNWLPL